MQLLVNTGVFISEHEAVLNNLDWWQHRGQDEHHYYAKEAFEKGLNTFNGLPIVFSNINHPRAKHPGEDINKYLKDIDGRIVGYTKNSIINNMGSPKLFSTFDITDKEVDGLISTGDIYLSSAFWYDGPKVGSLSNITGDHVLLFQRSKGGVRGDPGAMILNAYFDDSLDNGATNMADGDKTDPPAQKTGDPVVSTYERILMTNQSEIVSLKTENEKLKTDLADANKLITNKDEEITRLNGELEKVAAEKKKNDQSLMLNSLFVQGTIDHFKERIGAGELDDPVKFRTLLSEMGTYDRKLPKPNLQSPSGNNFIENKGGKPGEQAEEDAETLAAMNDMKSVVGR